MAAVWGVVRWRCHVLTASSCAVSLVAMALSSPSARSRPLVALGASEHERGTKQRGLASLLVSLPEVCRRTPRMGCR